MTGTYNRETTLVVEEVPEVNCDGAADGDECEETDIFCAHDERESDAGSAEPCPPCLREGLMTETIEADVCPNRQGHA